MIFGVLQKTRTNVTHEWVCCHDEASNHQWPVAAAFWIIWIVSVEECSSLTQNLMQIHCSTCSVILNAMATQYTCSLNGVYHPHWLVQWSHHCSHMHIPVHSPWLPGDINVTQTILVIFIMAELFLDRPRICARMFIATLFIIAKKCKQLTYSSTDEQINKMWAIHTGGYY